ncbi:MAG TPA: crotonase/enoyl-CoA hydratase family protein [Acidimicrobiales bacterium]|nr:crotonase/enoyl-CoA hydratase family protein [Acidimicrobiales bacterium]
MAFTSDVLTLEMDGPIATLWLDRPEAHNAMGSAFWNDLPLACNEVTSNDALRVLVIAAKGPHFTVGLDLKEMGIRLAKDQSNSANSSRANASAATYRAIRSMQDSINAVANLAIPTIAAVHGYCIGAGVDLICACDMRFACADAVFSVRETKVAIVADLGTLQRLPHIVGAGHVAELAFTGKDIDAARAAKIGLVNDVHGRHASDVQASTYLVAGLIAANSPIAVRGTKEVLGANDGRTVAEGLEFVARWNTMYLQSNDLVEAMTAFIERRPPLFRGD